MEKSATGFGPGGRDRARQPQRMRFGRAHLRAYVYDIRRAVRPGLNRLELVVANNLVHAHPDNFSHFVQITPSGLLGPVWLMK